MTTLCVPHHFNDLQTLDATAACPGSASLACSYLARKPSLFLPVSGGVLSCSSSSSPVTVTAMSPTLSFFPWLPAPYLLLQPDLSARSHSALTVVPAPTQAGCSLLSSKPQMNLGLCRFPPMKTDQHVPVAHSNIFFLHFP